MKVALKIQFVCSCQNALLNYKLQVQVLGVVTAHLSVKISLKYKPSSKLVCLHRFQASMYSLYIFHVVLSKFTSQIPGKRFWGGTKSHNACRRVYGQLHHNVSQPRADIISSNSTYCEIIIFWVSLTERLSQFRCLQRNHKAQPRRVACSRLPYGIWKTTRKVVLVSLRFLSPRFKALVLLFPETLLFLIQSQTLEPIFGNPCWMNQ